jgi:hypothetical protein
MLKARINKLEQRARARAVVGSANDVDDVDEERKLAQFRSDLVILFYNTWRHAGMTLLQKLALARDDLRRTPNDRHVIRAVRELEIRIGLVDEKIDDETAWELRANADQHFGLGERRPELVKLFFTIEFNEAEALRSARTQCPRVETLPLERQLAMHEEDHARDLRERERRAECGQLDPSMDAVTDKMHEVRARELRQKIHDRDLKAPVSATTIDE